jgi:hypothetical protein
MNAGAPLRRNFGLCTDGSRQMTGSGCPSMLVIAIWAVLRT